MVQSSLKSPFGVIAGNGVLPYYCGKSAASLGLDVYTVAHLGEADDRVKDFSKKVEWIKVGQLGKMINFLKKNGVKQCVFVGGIKRVKLFSGFFPDLRGISFFSKQRDFRDDALLSAFGKELLNEGIEVISCAEILTEFVPDSGRLTSADISEELLACAEIGWTVSKKIGECDVGQTVVLSGKTVIAVEAIEGTDACIRRANELGVKNLVVVKTCKPNQDLRFDLPTIGKNTIELLKEVDCKLLVVEAGKSLILEPKETLELADKCGISIISR